MYGPWTKFLCLLFFSVGIICYFFGCNPDYTDQCYNYNVVSGVSVGYALQYNICDKCLKHSKDNVYCAQPYFYECWDTNIKFKYGNNQTCYYTIVSNTPSKDYAIVKGTSYPKNETKKMIKARGLSCTDFDDGMNRWLAGIGFLSLSGLFLLVIIIEKILYYTCNIKLDDYDDDINDDKNFSSVVQHV